MKRKRFNALLLINIAAIAVVVVWAYFFFTTITYGNIAHLWQWNAAGSLAFLPLLPIIGTRKGRVLSGRALFALAVSVLLIHEHFKQG